jgi:hypothetical protein
MQIILSILRVLAVAIASVCVVALSGCANLCDSSFSQLGPDTYQVHGSCGGPREVESAAPFCARMGKNVMVTNTHGYSDNGITVIRCLSPNDPGYQRPTYQKSPNVIIQDNRK